MLFHVRMNVNLPLNIPAEQAAQLKQTEKELAQRLQHEGKWRHLWRIAGQYANVSVFDVDSVDELHNLLTSLPLFPYMQIDVMPLCRHPSSVRGDDS
ncbi:muconolactone delta-isomerase [Janthinobacterium sp. HH103]|uniref:muconolactone Delta-isomerase n=1 Tax=unclassified Janthinobacterium TaxID=2610881 RepID=UPI0008735533|nr:MULTISPECIES: muconolactone Delta-isomerase [unclassified Janthinobacterium]OEZ66955.1 muconolactone delta-isomerase [Janthinobacterium sp. HH100]OEZ83503.1 muconolactone delta-isomerase [Janthinobacterium sp. HH103]QOU71894.1 Muconolactone Delta-isomerase [Janthinobacterium sp. HH102]